VCQDSFRTRAYRYRQSACAKKGPPSPTYGSRGSPSATLAIEVRSHDALLLDIVIVQIVGALPELAHSN
jgi:hypothetical protein